MKPLILEALDIGHSEVVPVVELVEASGAVAELVEVTTLSAFSGRKAMRSDTEPGSQASRTLRFDPNPMMVRKLIVIKYLSRSE